MENKNNNVLTPEQIAALFDSQDESETVEAPVEEASVSEVETEIKTPTEPTADSSGMLTPEQIAALFDSQDESETVEVPVEAVSVSEVETEIKTDLNPQTEPTADSSSMLTPEQIAALFDSQDEPKTVEAPVEEASVSEVETEAKTPTEPTADSSGMLTPDQIAALFDSQDESETVEVPVEAASVSEVEATEIKTETKTPTEPTADSSGMLTPEQIAALFDSQDESEAVEAPVEEASVSEVETEIKTPTEPTADSNGMLTPEQIAALFDSQDEAETVEAPVEEASVSEVETEIKTPTEPTADSSGMLTPEQIAALFDSQDEAEAVEAPVEEASVSEVETETKTPAEPTADSSGMLTPEQIAALFDSQDEAEAVEAPVEEASVSEVEATEIKTETKTPAEPTADSSGMLTPEQIAALFDSQDETEAVSAPVEEATKPETEPSADSNGMLTPEQIAALFDSQDEAEAVEAPVEEASVSEVEATDTATEELIEEVVNIANEDNPVNSPPKEKFIIKNYLTLFIKVLLSTISRLKPAKTKVQKKSIEQSTSVEEISTNSDAAAIPLDDISTDISEIETSDNPVEVPEEIPSAPEKTTKGKKSKKQKRSKPEKNPDKNSNLKSPGFVVVALILISTSFAAGYFSRDFLSILKPDPAKVAIQNEEKAKLAEQKAKDAANEKRAKELANINPKDYTSSMYLESLILKGQAENKTSIKLNKIDDVSLLSQFPKLRRIRLQDMKGNENLSVIGSLNAVEEILIENSVLKNQFTSGSFDSVKYLELNECTIEDSKQFANFKKTTEFYADSTKFTSKEGNVEITSLMPALESLKLINCGEYMELVGAGNLISLKELKLSDNTIIKNTSYAQNQRIEKLTVDISFVNSADQLMALSSLQNLKVLVVEVGSSPLSRSDLIATLNRIAIEHPELSIEITGS